MAFGDLLTPQLTGAANSITNPFSATGAGTTVAVGDLVVAVIGEQTGLTVTACADNLGNTYSAVNAGTDGGSITGRCYYARVTVAGSLTSVSFTTTASANNVAAVAAAFAGPFATSPLDAAPANNNNTDNASPFQCPATGSLVQAEELVICWMCGQSNATWSASSPLLKATQIVSQSVADTILGYQVTASTASIAPAFTGTNPTASVQGTASFKKDLTQALTPSLVPSANSIFDQTVSPGAANLLPSSLPSTNDFLLDDITFFIPVVVSQAAAAQDLAPSLVPSSESFFTHTVAAGAVDLAPTLIPTSNSFNTHAITSTVDLAPSLVPSENSFPSHTVTAGASDLAPSLIPSENTFSSHTVSTGAVDLAPSLIPDSNSFFTHDVALGAAPNRVNVSWFEVEGVEASTTGQSLTQTARYNNSSTIYGPTVSAGVVNLSPSLVPSTTSFPAHAVSAGAVDLAPSLIPSSNSFPAHTVTLGAGTQDLAPPLIPSSNAVPAHVVSSVVALVQTAVVPHTNFFYAHFVIPGATNLAPLRYDNASTIYTPVVGLEGGPQILLPALVPSSNSFPPHTVTVGSVNLAPSLVPHTNSFNVHVVAAGAVNLAPSLVPSVGNFKTPLAVAVGAVTLSPSLIPSGNIILPHSVTGAAVSQLFPPLMPSSSFVYRPTVYRAGDPVAGARRYNNPMIVSPGVMMRR